MAITASMNDNLINELAFEWLTRADGGLSSTEQAKLSAWLAADSRHFGAYMRAKAVFIQASRAKAFAHSPNPDEWLLNIGTAEPATTGNGLLADNDIEDSAPIARRAFFGLAGGVAAAGIGFAFLATGQQAQALTFRTKRGEMQNFSLEDGTKILLNTDSEIRVMLDNNLRKVEFVRGEAIFDVAYDEHRPFLVDAKSFMTRAVGTSFALRKTLGIAPQIVVKKGSVDLTPYNSTSLRVDANTQVTVFSGGRVLRKMLTGPELDRELIWREGKIAFNDTSLRDAIATFARYGDTYIEVNDPALLNETVTGVFSSNDPMGFAKSVAQIFDVEAIPEGRGVILRSSE